MSTHPAFAWQSRAYYFVHNLLFGAALTKGSRSVHRASRRPIHEGMLVAMRRSLPDLPQASRLDAVLDFMRLLWSIEHGLQSASKHMEGTLGITGPQRLVLRIVGQ